ncbi:hypothetical protein JMF94_13015 [Desulfovibrio sp. UIB00]|nr:hypothetical protein [Desulfovibrio sp. UIB00]
MAMVFSARTTGAGISFQLRNKVMRIFAVCRYTIAVAPYGDVVMRFFMLVMLLLLTSCVVAVASPVDTSPERIVAAPVQDIVTVANPAPDPAPPAPPSQMSALEREEKVFSTHISLMAYGFAVLAVFAGILALGGIILPFLLARTYKTEIKLKAALIAGHELRLKTLVEQGEKHCQSLRDMAKRIGVTEAFGKEVIEEAMHKIRFGTGSEVLWGKAILAQEDKQWDKAYTYWTSILEEEKENTSALFGAALACAELFERRNYDPTFLSIVDEGFSYLKRIPYAQINAPVLNRWGRLLYDQSCAVTDPDDKANLQKQASNKYIEATKCDPTYPNAWSNWGADLADRAKEEPDLTRKADLQKEAAEKISKAIQCDQKCLSAWNNWGNLLVDQADEASDLLSKAELQEQAMDKFRTATECDPKESAAWNNWGRLLTIKADEESNPVRKAELQKQAVDKCRTAVECNPKNSDALLTWGYVLADQADATSDLVHKAALQEQAIGKYRIAIECDPKKTYAWNNWGNILVTQANATSDLARKAELQEQAIDKYRTAIECAPMNSMAWSNWGLLLDNKANEEIDPARKAELQEQAREKFRRAEECSNSE